MTLPDGVANCKFRFRSVYHFMLSKVLPRWRALLAAQSKQAAATANGCGYDLTDSRAGQIGNKLVTASLVINTLMPVLAVVAVLLVAAVTGHAQTPNGDFFNADPTTAGRGIVEFIKYFRNLLFLAGLFFFGWAALNLGFERSWGFKVAGAVGCWGFATFAATCYQFAQGKAVQFDTNLGS